MILIVIWTPGAVPTRAGLLDDRMTNPVSGLAKLMDCACLFWRFSFGPTPRPPICHLPCCQLAIQPHPAIRHHARIILANNPQICFDNLMRAGEASYRAHAAGSCPALTNDLRSPVSNRVKHTGRPLCKDQSYRSSRGSRIQVGVRVMSTIYHKCFRWAMVSLVVASVAGCVGTTKVEPSH